MIVAVSAAQRRPSWFSGIAAAASSPSHGGIITHQHHLGDETIKTNCGWSRGGAAIKAKKTRGGETAMPGLSSSVTATSAPSAGGTAAAAGGDASAAHHRYTAVSTVVWGEQQDSDDDASIRFLPGCQLLGDSLHWIGEGTWRDDHDSAANKGKALGGNTPALWKTLAFLSDVMVLVLNTRDPIELDLVNALEAGFQARQRDLPKGRLLIVLHGGGSLSKQEMQEWKTRLSSTLEGSAPRIVEELVIVPSSEYSSALHRMKTRVARKNDGVCQLADSETFPSLVKQVHRAFGGGNQNLLKPASSVLPSLVVTPPVPPPRTRSPVSSASTAAKRSAAATTTTVRIDEKQALEELLARANELLDGIQVAQENALLDSSKSGGAVVPINFSGRAQRALSKIEKSLRSDKAVVSTATYQTVVSHVKGRVRVLYQQQLEAMRDYYGKLYESALAKTARKSWRDAATKTTDRFRKAAENTVPALVRPGKIFEDADLSYFRSLAESGLISDMMEATDIRQDTVADEDEDDYLEDPTLARAASKRVAAWYEKLAARALVIGVNYIQGWLAWQGIKRAALLREQQMPKFPLF